MSPERHMVRGGLAGAVYGHPSESVKLDLFTFLLLKENRFYSISAEFAGEISISYPGMYLYLYLCLYICLTIYHLFIHLSFSLPSLSPITNMGLSIHIWGYI